MILKTGQLKRKDSNKLILEPYQIKLIGESELTEVQSLQQFVYNKLPNKDVLSTDSYEVMMQDLEAGGMILGVYNSKNELIAYRFVTFPKNQESNLGKDLHLSPQSLQRVAHLETTLVHPDYRGNKLQSDTLGIALPIIAQKGYQHVMCTVSPVNPFSLYNVMSHGLKIKALKRKYGTPEGNPGLWRFILHKDLDVAPNFKIDNCFNINLNALEVQSELINEGFVGTSLNRETSSLQYVKFATV